MIGFYIGCVNGVEVLEKSVELAAFSFSCFLWQGIGFYCFANAVGVYFAVCRNVLRFYHLCGKQRKKNKGEYGCESFQCRNTVLRKCRGCVGSDFSENAVHHPVY